MDVKDVKIEESWKNVLQAEFDTQYFRDLRDFVRGEHIAEKPVYPKATEIFQAFNACPFDKVKVVILGQDPYHGTATDTQGLTVEQANGLSFAVHTGIPLPPSLKNIFKEIESDIGITPLQDGDLNRWAKQGVLLLNATLTVAAHQPGSHQKRGWEEFTDAAIRALSDRREHIVFLLWGNYAKQKGAHIDRTKHLVLETTHPSPFSVHNGFFGSKHFSKTNTYLREHDLSTIDWK
jgi:uracil-DNA glycosylase